MSGLSIPDVDDDAEDRDVHDGHQRGAVERHRRHQRGRIRGVAQQARGHDQRAEHRSHWLVFLPSLSCLS